MGIEFQAALAGLEVGLDVGAPEAVDALGIVAHHTDVFVHGAQQLDDLVLRRIGILVFIDQDVFEFPLVFAQTFWKIPEELIEFQ